MVFNIFRVMKECTVEISAVEITTTGHECISYLEITGCGIGLRSCSINKKTGYNNLQKAEL